MVTYVGLLNFFQKMFFDIKMLEKKPLIAYMCSIIMFNNSCITTGQHSIIVVREH